MTKEDAIDTDEAPEQPTQLPQQQEAPMVSVRADVIQFCYQLVTARSPVRADFADSEQFVTATQNNLTTIMALEAALAPLAEAAEEQAS